MSTFQGIVRSLGGFYAQGPATIVSLTANTTLDPTIHAGKLIVLNGAAITVTLPLSNAVADPISAGPGNDPNTLNNQGIVYNFLIGTAATGVKIRTASSTPGDLFIGQLTIANSSTNADTTWIPNASSNDVINLNGTTTGGAVGSYLSCVVYANARYFVQGMLIGSSTNVTPFADS